MNQDKFDTIRIQSIIHGFQLRYSEECMPVFIRYLYKVNKIDNSYFYQCMKCDGNAKNTDSMKVALYKTIYFCENGKYDLVSKFVRDYREHNKNYFGGNIFKNNEKDMYEILELRLCLLQGNIKKYLNSLFLISKNNILKFSEEEKNNIESIKRITFFIYRQNKSPINEFDQFYSTKIKPMLLQ